MMPWLFLLCLAPFGNEAPAPAVPASQLSEWLHYLASDEMKGRVNGSPELEQAAEWLAEKYKEFGLTPLPGQDSYFQSFEATKPNRRSQAEAVEPAKPVTVRNVIGYLEGSDPKLKDEYIVLTAHYDHVAFNPRQPSAEDSGEEQDTIMNGADDDGSGVVTILGMAASLQKLNLKPKRSIVVMAVAAEEWGLLGSRHYVKNPMLPFDKMVVNLNYELTGHSTKTGKNKFFMTGADYSDLHEVIRETAKEHGWEMVENPFKQMRLFFRSDNAAFAMMDVDREAKTAVGVPAHAFSTWGGEDHYHQPHDEPGIVDYENMAGLVHVMTHAMMKLADGSKWPAWQENDLFEFSRPAAEK